MKATINCPVRYHFVNILLIFTFSGGLKALELAFPFLGHIMITRQSSAAQNRGDTCKASENVMTVLAYSEAVLQIFLKYFGGFR